MLKGWWSENEAAPRNTNKISFKPRRVARTRPHVPTSGLKASSVFHVPFPTTSSHFNHKKGGGGAHAHIQGTNKTNTPVPLA